MAVSVQVGFSVEVSAAMGKRRNKEAAPWSLPPLEERRGWIDVHDEEVRRGRAPCSAVVRGRACATHARMTPRLAHPCTGNPLGRVHVAHATGGAPADASRMRLCAELSRYAASFRLWPPLLSGPAPVAGRIRPALLLSSIHVTDARVALLG